ncbi:MAG: HD domain-containing protein [Candidatus Omnitrophica bacterium]|nr:HD domain-containing protein [Candidatus Omnitrophota bacterium]
MMPANSILLLMHNEDTLRYFREQLLIDGGYAVTAESDPAVALGLFKQNPFDVVLTASDIPGYEGARILREIKAVDPYCVVLLYAETLNYELMEDAAGLGIYDFVTKPINAEKLFNLVRKGIELHTLQISHARTVSILKEQNTSLQKQNILLAKRIEDSARNLARLYEDLRVVYMRTIRVLAHAIDARDHYTHDHSENVAKYAVAIARQMNMTVKEIEVIRDASELHDLGKIGIEDTILMKPAGLTPEEWQLVKLHPQMGAQILEPLTFLTDVIELVRQHHEHFDGSGYPAGRKGDDIMLGARIIHLADAFEAMTSPRSYRKVPFTKDEAIAEITRNAKTQFDPRVVDAFMQVAHNL